MNFDKQIWKLFKMNRNEFNKADRNIEKILSDIYNKGIEHGKKEERKRIKAFL